MRLESATTDPPRTFKADPVPRRKRRSHEHGLALMVGTILLVAAGKGEASKIDAPEPAISAGEYWNDEDE